MGVTRKGRTMAETKTPEWKQIMDQQKAKFADRSDKLKAARLAHQATLPPEPVKKPRARKAKAAGA